MPQKCQALYARALEVKPNNISGLVFTAQTAIAAAEYAGAKDVYLTALDINPISLSAL
jgi:cytochrome c-type biogenesis protein CcmH/NrfG